MERRKFIIGAGALATGSSAAVGTGALSSQSSTRSVSAAVVNDNNGLVGLNIDDSSLENTEYASHQNGQLTLTFEGASNSGSFSSSDGLNPDSTLYFDNVFQIRNQTEDTLAIDIDKSGLDNSSAFTFYGAWTNGKNMNRDSDWNGQTNAGQGVNIGVKIETPDNVNAGWESGNIVINAEDPGDQNNN
ncbi:DUF1102 domain-containing protein [Halorubrum aquaticum]|uniref:DUF1102 domain-containing protein n=1 Tax=Halorubrum aquaticum TaxID=387340 RepID=UPI00122CFE89|nr:DUF1102 domain-containing protein [Halorubrum aquaticum]